MVEMSEARIKRALLSRSTAFSRLNEAYSVALKAKTDENFVSLLEAYISQLDNMYAEFKETHNEILGLISEDDATFQEHDSIRSKADSFYFGIKSIMIQVKTFNQVSNPGPSTSSQSASPRLPRIAVPIFDGYFKEWPAFIDLFNSLIHNNTQLANIEKFHYLVTSLAKEPLALVKAIPMSESNYLIAYETLLKRYQNKRKLATGYYHEILNLPNLQRASSKDLRHLIDSFTENLSALPC